MDAKWFDELIARLARGSTRRTALGGALGVIGASSAASAKKKGKKRKGQGKDRNKNRSKSKTKAKNGKKRSRAQQLPDRCCSNGNCSPGKGKNLAKCCYESQDVSGRTFNGANLGNANFRGANAANANFKGANLNKTCFVDANVTGAKFGGANLSGAIFCRTQTSQGIDNSDCGRDTTCCQTCLEVGAECLNGANCCSGICTGGVCASYGG